MSASETRHPPLYPPLVAWYKSFNQYVITVQILAGSNQSEAYETAAKIISLAKERHSQGEKKYHSQRFSEGGIIE